MADYALFLGCVIPTKLPQVEMASRFVLKKLGITLHEMEGASCCPEPISSQSMSIQLWASLAARNLCIAESMEVNGKKGMDVITLCAGCFETLRTVQTLLDENEALKVKVNNQLKQIGLEYKGTSKVYHFVEILTLPEYRNKLLDLIIKPLEGLNISAHYGCHLIRPSKVLHFDNPEHPETMDSIIKAIGANSIESPEKLSCCGQCVKLDHSVGEKMVHDKIIDMQKNSIDGITVVCPGCFTQLDQTQKIINKNLSEDEPRMKTPVIYLSELIAIAIGLPIESLDLKKRAIKPIELISKLSIS